MDATRIRLRSRARSSMGTATRFSTATNANAETTATARQPRVAADVQPQSLPSLRARMMGVRMSATKTLPAMSIDRGRFSSRDSVTLAAVIAMHTPATPASTQNRPCQLVTSTRTPPSSGPRAAPTPAAAPQSETARNRPSCGVPTVSRLSPQARIVAPEAPWMQRPAMTISPEVDSAISTHERDEEQQAELEDALPTEHVAQRTGGHDGRGTHQRVAGDRPLQRRGGHPGVLADRGEQDADGGRVGVDHQRGQTRDEQDSTSGGHCVGAAHRIFSPSQGTSSGSEDRRPGCHARSANSWMRSA